MESQNLLQPHKQLLHSVAQDYEIDQILYCSLATEPFSTSALDKLVQHAGSLNKLDRITGMLMYGDGVFLQLLEGPPEAIGQLWSRLLRDKRHYGMVQLYHRREVEARVCDNWAMRLVSREEVTALIHEAKEEVLAGRKTAWAPAIERMDFFLTHSGWPQSANEGQLPDARSA
jgi:hypothetical protein